MAGSSLTPSWVVWLFGCLVVWWCGGIQFGCLVVWWCGGIQFDTKLGTEAANEAGRLLLLPQVQRELPPFPALTPQLLPQICTSSTLVGTPYVSTPSIPTLSTTAQWELSVCSSELKLAEYIPQLLGGCLLDRV